MLVRLLAFCGIIFLTQSLSAKEFNQIEFMKNGKIVKAFGKSDFQKGVIEVEKNFIGSIDLPIYNAWRDYYRTYRGYSLREFLGAVYGDDWKKGSQLTFIAADGYRQTSKVSDLLDAFDKHEGIIAYTETGKKGFTKLYNKNKVVSLEPFYLVWSGFKRGEKAKHTDLLKWPYQLVKINLSFKK